MLNYVKNLPVLLVACLLVSAPLGAQGAPATGWMEETMYSSGKINVVLGVVSLLLIGLFIYLIMLDRKVKKVENEINNTGI